VNGTKLAVTAALFCSLAAAQSGQLRYAVIVSRHGVRSPTWTETRLNEYSASPWPDFGVAPGLLTAHGRDLMRLMGAFYRDYFKDLAVCGRVSIFADSAERTRVTAEALNEGMLPGCPGEIHALKEGDSDPLFDGGKESSAAPIAGRLGPDLEALTAAHRPALEELNRILGKTNRSLLDDRTVIDGSSLSGPISLASTLAEDLLLEYANGLSGSKLGWGRLTPRNLLEILSLHTAYADLTRRTPAIARARGSNLLNAVARSLEQAAAGKSVPGAIGAPSTKLLVISGHDTNISNLSGLLGLSWLLPGYPPDDTPPGGALIFTLWEESPGRYTVRLRYTAQTPDQMHDMTPLSLTAPPPSASLFTPACSTSEDGYPCALNSFLAAAREATGSR